MVRRVRIDEMCLEREEEVVDLCKAVLSYGKKEG
jgi:hypothetical protein